MLYGRALIHRFPPFSFTSALAALAFLLPFALATALARLSFISLASLPFAFSANNGLEIGLRQQHRLIADTLSALLIYFLNNNCLFGFIPLTESILML